MTNSVPEGFEIILFIIMGVAAIATVGYLIYGIYEGINFIIKKLSKWKENLK